MQLSVTQGKSCRYLIFGRETIHTAVVVSSEYFTCHQYNPGKSYDIGHG